MAKKELIEPESESLQGAAWSRFERAVDAAVKSGPMHKTATKPKERPASKGRVHKGETRD
jgi:hypothetical protein